MLLEASTLAAVALLSIGAAIVGGMGGFGTGVILAAALVPLIGVKALVPVMAVAGVIINAGRFWFYRESLERRTLGVALVSALPFLVFGTWLYSVLDARSVGTILGLAVIASVPLRRILRKKAVMLNRPGLAVGSGIFGLASGLATGTGVILVSLLLGTGMSGPAVLATDALVSIALDLTKAALFQRFNLLDAQAFFTGVVIGVASIPGSAIAAALVTRVGAKLHVVFIETLIVVGGASMLWHSWR
ncbi:MAG TPA: TSUP family transporter [Burkholderiales bacterium]|nr:TSUP family transporter [Burkholderiales bacterium]